MKKVLIIGGIVLAMTGLVGFKSFQVGHTAIPVQVASVMEGTLAETVLASGNFIFNEQINIRPQVSGRVELLLVEEGDFVEQGQLLMQLDPKAFEAEVEKAQADVNGRLINIEEATETLANLIKQRDRSQALVAEKLVHQEQVDDLVSQVNIAQVRVKAAQYNLKRAQASLKFAEDQLAKTRFIAPRAGLISSLDIKEGETVIAGTTNIVGSDLMTIADPSRILAELRVDEADISNIAMDQKVELYAAAWPKQAFTGRVTKIGTSAKKLGQSAGLSFSVKVLLDASSLPLYPGMSCRAEIITQNGDSTTNVPIAAVQYQQDQPFVWVVNDANVQRKDVSLGMASDTEQAILEGVTLGETVVVGPARTMSQLQEQDTVSLKETI